MLVNGAKHEYEQRNYYDYDPRTMDELSDDKDAQHNKSSNRPDGIDHDGLLPMCAVCHLVRHKQRSTMLGGFQFGIGDRLSIDGPLLVLDMYEHAYREMLIYRAIMVAVGPLLTWMVLIAPRWL